MRPTSSVIFMLPLANARFSVSRRTSMSASRAAFCSSERMMLVLVLGTAMGGEGRGGAADQRRGAAGGDTVWQMCAWNVCPFETGSGILRAG